MRMFMLCGALSLIGLFACVPSREDVEPGPGDDDLTEEAPAESALTTCCIDFTCPSPDFDTTGCKTGAGPSIAEARAACEADCPVMCASSGLYCR